MASTSTRRSWNSRATSSTSSSVGVTRTHPKAPMISRMRSSRAPVPLRLALACGLMTTPMPDMCCCSRSGRGTRRGELAAGGLDVATPALANRGGDAVLAEDRLEAEHPGAWAGLEAGVGKGVERNEVHLGAQPMKQADERARVAVGVVLAVEQHVLERDAPAAGERHGPAGREQRRQRIAPVDRDEP